MKHNVSKIVCGMFVACFSYGAIANGAAVALLMQQDQKKEEEKNIFYNVLKSVSPAIINDGFIEYKNYFKVGPETRFCEDDEVVFKNACYTEIKTSDGFIDKIEMKNKNNGYSAQEGLDNEYGKNSVMYVGMGVITRPFNISAGKYYDSVIVFYKILDDKQKNM